MYPTNGMSIVVHNRQPAIVAVKSGLYTIRRCKYRRQNIKIERCERCCSSGDDVVGIALLYAVLRGIESIHAGGHVFVRHSLAAKIAHTDVVMASGGGRATTSTAGK